MKPHERPTAIDGTNDSDAEINTLRLGTNTVYKANKAWVFAPVEFVSSVKHAITLAPLCDSCMTKQRSIIKIRHTIFLSRLPIT